MKRTNSPENLLIIERQCRRVARWSFARIGLSGGAAAEFMVIGTTLFDRMVSDGRMPLPRALDGRTVWDREEVEAAFRELPYHGAKIAKENSDWSRVK